jgi:2-hydroxy-3-keto-5-methylthiopentenyl-1-phosphate phosphatase
VKLSYKISRPQRVVGLTALNAKDIILLNGNEETSLVKYFKEKHGHDIAYQDVPVVILSGRRDTFIPMELCMVVKQQSCRDAKQQYNHISVRQSEHISTQRFK